MLARTISTFAILGFLADCAIIPSSDIRLFNPPTPSFNTTNEILFQCRGSQYGTNLDYGSCLNAFLTFTKRNSLVPLNIGTRNTGIYDQNLPWKWVSGDGRCTFDFRLRATETVETTTGQDISNAAWRLMHECLRVDDMQGGIVSGIGDGSNLAIIMQSYDPTHIECGNVIQRYTAEDKCDEVLRNIPATRAPRMKWGPGGHQLPYFWQVVGKACRLMLWGSGGRHEQTDMISNYEIWTAGVMLAGKCARYDRSGMYSHLGLGENGRLWVILDDGRPAGLTQVGNSSTNERLIGGPVVGTA